MLNKIKIIGKVILKEEKAEDKKNSLEFTVGSPETENELGGPELGKGEP